MNPILKQLIKLQETDYEILDYQKHLDMMPKQIETSRSHLAVEKENLDTVLKEIDDLKQQRANLERDVQAENDHMSKAKIKLPDVKTNKEYSAILSEIDGIKQKVADIEDRELEIMELLEEKEKGIPEAEAVYKDHEKMHLDFKAQKESDIKRVNEDLEAIKLKRDTLVGVLDPKWASTYEKLSNYRGENVVVQLVDDQCQGCHQQIKLQLMIDVKIGKKVYECDRCNRILYWIPEEETETVAPE